METGQQTRLDATADTLTLGARLVHDFTMIVHQLTGSFSTTYAWKVYLVHHFLKVPYRPSHRIGRSRRAWWPIWCGEIRAVQEQQEPIVQPCRGYLSWLRKHDEGELRKLVEWSKQVKQKASRARMSTRWVRFSDEARRILTPFWKILTPFGWSKYPELWEKSL